MNHIVQMRSGGTALLPIYPATFDESVRFARMAIIAGMIKPIVSGYGDKRKVETEEAMEARATMVVLQGMEIGLPPMQAIQLLAMINGRITAHSEAVPGLLWSNGIKIKDEWSGTEMSDDWTAICTVTRPDGERVTRKFSVSDAKRAKLWSPAEKITKKGPANTTYQDDNESPWHKYPQRMLWARALGFAARDGAADALRGLMVREELEDMIRSGVARDVTPIAAPPMAELEPPNPDAEPPAVAEEPSDDITDVDGFIEHYRSEVVSLEGEFRQEFIDANADIVARLPKTAQAKISAILEAA